jgi:hypothetical protein
MLLVSVAAPLVLSAGRGDVDRALTAASDEAPFGFHDDRAATSSAEDRDVSGMGPKSAPVSDKVTLITCVFCSVAMIARCKTGLSLRG